MQKNSSNDSFESLLEESVKTHGHLCPGQVLGVRMSMLGISLVGISDPKGEDRKKLIVYIEIDRCATDAIQSRIASLTASRSVFEPLSTGHISAPKSCMLKTFGFCRRMSSLPI